MDVKILEKEVHIDLEFERPNVEYRAEPRLSKYVKRHHLATQIIGDKDTRKMTRKKLRNDTCLLRKKETKIVKDTLEAVD